MYKIIVGWIQICNTPEMLGDNIAGWGGRGRGVQNDPKIVLMAPLIYSYVVSILIRTKLLKKLGSLDFVLWGIWREEF